MTDQAVATKLSIKDGVTVRTIMGPEELDVFCTLDYTLNHELVDDMAAGRRRSQWMWLALRDGRLVARAAWWGNSEDSQPLILDVLDINDDDDAIEVGKQMLKVALTHVVPNGATPPDYIRFIPPDWKEDMRSRRLVEGCMSVAGDNGARLFVERLRFEWRSDTPIASPSGRLIFRPVAEDAELTDLMTLVLEGTLDAQSKSDLLTIAAEDVAEQHFRSEFSRYGGTRNWWRIGTLPTGEPVGFVIPARNDYGAIIAYIGVVPQRRGKGYVDELLTEGMRILAEQGVPRVRAATDLGNVPMADAFVRSGWRNFEGQITMKWTHVSHNPHSGGQVNSAGK